MVGMSSSLNLMNSVKTLKTDYKLAGRPDLNIVIYAK